MNRRKIINDPIYGFITIDDDLVFDILNHPYFQRLRRVKQMALASYIFPGATHSRFQHSLGAYHLMTLALEELKSKGIEINKEEKKAAQIGILLHDIGHGPFSHSLENILFPNISHELVSEAVIQELNHQFKGQLDLTIKIFSNQYPRTFFHQLLSSQMDVDRMDYLNRDSYFSGVAEGKIGYDRILKMILVHNNQLIFEEKALYSLEKFLIARRLMYLQVYLHKTVWVTEKLLVQFVKRIKYLIAQDSTFSTQNKNLDFFLKNKNLQLDNTTLQKFLKLDDDDIMMAIKVVQDSPDKVLSIIAQSILNRQLFKIKTVKTEKEEIEFYNQKKQELKSKFSFSDEDINFLVFTERVHGNTYDIDGKKILVLNKENELIDISSVENALINSTLFQPVEKKYIAYYFPN